MESLIRSLRNLGLSPPKSGQLLELLDEDEEVQTRLIKLLAFNVPSEVEEGGSVNDISALMGQDLLQEAVKALLENFKKTIEKQKQVAEKELELMNASSSNENQNGKNVKNSSNKKLKLPPRKAMLLRHDAAQRKDEEERSSSLGYRPRLVFDGSLSFHSQKQLKDLDRIFCKELDFAPRRYEGKYLLVRVISSLILYVGASFLAEDSDGNVLPIAISHFTSNINATNEEISKLLPIGIIIAVREPFLSIDYQARVGPCSGKAEIGIRVDSPTDVIILDKVQHASILEEVKWTTELPNEKGKEGEFIPWLYDPIHSQDWKQMASQLYKAGRMGAAYRALKRSQNHSVNSSLQSSILFNLNAWSEAKDVLLKNENTKELNGNSEYHKETDFSIPFEHLNKSQSIERCALRQTQASQGITMDDVQSIYFSAPHTPRFDTSDFIGPVAVKDIDNAGRGLVLTRDVEPGELLLCCRAIGAAYPDDEESKNSPILRLNLNNGVVSTTSQVRAQTNLIHSIVDRPELALPILGLTAGPSMEYSKYVSEPYPMTTKPELEQISDDSNLHPSIDPAYIDGVLRFNAFGPAQSPARTSKDGKKELDIDEGELGKSTMPHPLPAILNHACLPNVASIFFSNIVTTRALIGMKKGTEIVHQYVRGEIPFAVRSAQLSKHGFECRCELCMMDRSDGQVQYTQRARIMQGESSAIFERSRVLMKRIDLTKLGNVEQHNQISEDDLDAHRDLLDSLQQLHDRVNATYAESRGNLRPELLAIFEVMVKHVALVSDDQSRIKNVQNTIFDAIKCVGGSADSNRKGQVSGIFINLPRLHIDGVVGLILLMAVILTNSNDLAQAKEWTQSAFYAHQCMIGGGLEVFMDRWRTIEFEPALFDFKPLTNSL